MHLHLILSLFGSFLRAASALRVHTGNIDDGLWLQKAKASTHEDISITIALASPEPEVAVQALLSVSDPKSQQYGEFWHRDDIQGRFSPTSDVIRLTLDWIRGVGVAAQQIRRTGGLVHVTCPVYLIQELLHTEVFHYMHKLTGAHDRGFEQYEVPSELKDDILWVLPTVEHRHGWTASEHPILGSIRKARTPEDCASSVTPECLRKIYNIPLGDFSHPNNSFGFFLPGWSTWLPSDLDRFFQKHAPRLFGHRPDVVPINDGYRQMDIQIGPYNLEPNMDAEYTMALSYPQNVTNYQVGDSDHPGDLNTMLAAFDASYCSHLSNEFDPIEGVSDIDCGTVEAPNVLSISYVWAENSFPPEYLAYQCHEFLKLGLQGVTVVVSTGDTGIARHPDGVCGDGGSNETFTGHFVPSWPASCPWVTAIGGTSFVNREGDKAITSWRNLPSAGPPRGKDIYDEVVYTHLHDNRTSSSGGGFSNTFATPQYQEEHLRRYYASEGGHLEGFQDLFNASGRGYPDAAAAATSVEIATGGRFHYAYGTSSSTPIFAAMIAKINNEQLRVGKSPVGFINPVLYGNAQAFRDVVGGHNSGCGVDDAFRASKGWDAATGLGSPDYEKLLEVFMQLQ